MELWFGSWVEYLGLVDRVEEGVVCLGWVGD